MLAWMIYVIAVTLLLGAAAGGAIAASPEPMVLDAGHHCFPSTADDYRVGVDSASQYRQLGGATENDRFA
jgi:hypothetical protein